MFRTILFATMTGIAMFAAASTANAGACGGPIRKQDAVCAYSTDTYTIRFHAGELARVTVEGDGDTQLDLYVYDENGNLIDSDVGPGDDCVATFRPKWTGVFKIKIVNRGRVYNQYWLRTN